MVTSLAAFAWFLLTQGRRYQVWHIHQYGLHAVLAVALSKLLCRPTVLKLTSSGSHGLQATLESAPLARLAKTLLRRVSGVVATSRETQVEAVAFGIPISRVHVLGNGVDIGRFQPRNDVDRVRLHSEVGVAAAGMVLFVGRLSEAKNPDGLLRAWQTALPRLPAGWHLILVGDGSMRAGLAAFVDAEGLASSVTLVGYQANIEAWMAAADIYVLASHREGLSNSLLEAMASGLPVVSTRVSATVEILEETGAGLVVEIGQMDLLAGALVRMARDLPLREQMGCLGRQVIEKEYSIDAVAARHERLYLHLINQSVTYGSGDTSVR
jgi:glycosyltransferase involved in cell wall biosynthesis